MLDYISGFIYIFWILCLCYFLGTAITNQKSFTTSLLVGYIGYSFVLAVGFIIIQLLGLPWRIWITMENCFNIFYSIHSSHDHIYYV